MLGVGFIFYYYLTILRSSLLPLLPLPSSTSSSSSTASSSTASSSPSPSPSLTLMSSTLPPTQYKVVEMNDRVPSFKLATNSGKPPYADGDRAQTAIINSLQLVEKCKQDPSLIVVDVGAFIGSQIYYFFQQIQNHTLNLKKAQIAKKVYACMK
ncbi:unnamed protein product [Rotaria sordida]|uniref:Uncharacterized protein n=1 Tax=Rotaria sordida TaxID=392033 RepID=A0A815LLK5_9BILA|nr:unnamed protein product [Rotaria sordida]